MKPFAKKILLVGLVISIIGLGLQWVYPMQIQTDVLQMNSTYPYSQEFSLKMPFISPNVTKFQMYFRLSVMSTTSANVSLFLLSDTDYERYLLGTPLDQVEILQNLTINELENEDYAFNEFHINLYGGIPYHVIIFNQTNANFSIAYFCSLTSSYYSLGLYILAYGMFMICAGFFIDVTGWRKWLIIGIGANLFVFFLRATLLPQDFSMVELGTNLLHPELYSDFQYYTINWAHKFALGVSPYSPDMESYLYSPLYYWIIGIFGLIPLPPWIIAVPLVTAILLTGYLVAQIVAKTTGREKAIKTAILIYYFNPLILAYGSMMWLNPSLFVCCIIGGIYALLQRRPAVAGVALGLATMFKQFAIIFLPLFMLTQYRLSISTISFQKENPTSKLNLNQFWNNIKDTGKLGLFFLIPIVGISIPYLIMDAPAYLYRWIWGNTNLSINYLTTFYSYDNYPVTFNTFFLAFHVNDSVILGIAYLLRYFVLLAGSLLAILIGFLLCTHLNSTKDPVHPHKVIWNTTFWGFLTVCAFQLFYPRGSYKYYLLFLVPFMALLVIQRMNTVVFENITPKHHKLPLWVSIIIVSSIIFLIHRYLYFPILLGWGIYLVIIRRKG